MTRPGGLPRLSASRSTHLVFLLGLWLSVSLSLPLVHASLQEEEESSSSSSPPIQKDTIADAVPDTPVPESSSSSSLPQGTVEDAVQEVVQEKVIPDTLPPSTETVTSVPLSLFPIMYDNHWGRPQLIQGPNRTAIYKRLQETDDYMTNIVYVKPQYATIRQDCTNKQVLCTYWAANGDCGKEWMNACSPACQTCDKLQAIMDDDAEEEGDDEIEWTNYGTFVPTDFGMPQNLGWDSPQEVSKIVTDTRHYIHQLTQDPDFQTKVAGCRNHRRECSIWAFEDSCLDNPLFMNKKCPAACQTCRDNIHIQPACLRDNYQSVMWDQPGQLNQMFQRVATDPQFQQYSPTVLSSPETTEGPWIITLDDFLTPDECHVLIQHGADQGYDESTTIGDINEDGTYDDEEVPTSRTSTNTWCDDASIDNPVIKGVIDRIEHLVQIPYSHAEFLQLLKYEPGQFYAEHHDWTENHLEEPSGARILTVFLYLNDVQEGGGTHFNSMNMTVMPQQGRAVLWPSVLDDASMAIDERTFHEALEVTAGNKYGANAWFHSRDIKGYWKGCPEEGPEGVEEEEEEWIDDEEEEEGVEEEDGHEFYDDEDEEEEEDVEEEDEHEFYDDEEEEEDVEEEDEQEFYDDEEKEEEEWNDDEGEEEEFDDDEGEEEEFDDDDEKEEFDHDEEEEEDADDEYHEQEL